MNIDALIEDAVGIGSTVTVRDVETNEVEVYTLVPPNRADISLNRISSLTPVAHALYGRRVGEIVEVSAPAGAIHLQIVSIRRPADEGEYG
jgi:transcription elongation factor GreA